jgi:hypothetical protein
MSSIKLKHSGGNSVSLNPPTSAPTSSEVAFKLPNADGSANQYMKTDGSGNLAFATVTTTVASADPLVTGTTTHINQTIGSGFTFNGITGTQLLGSVSNATDSSIYALIIRQEIVFQATGTNHNYVQGWLYQTDKTYNQQGTYVTHSVYNQYLQNYSFNYIVPWDPSGTQSLSMYVTYALLNGTNNSHGYFVGGKLSNE